MCQEAGGFYPPIAVLNQASLTEPLPKYVPQIHHRYSRKSNCAEKIVAIPTTKVIALGSRWPSLNGDDLRRYFKLSATTRVILVSVAQDHELEKIWRDMLSRDIPGFLRQLNVEYVTSPNFSIPIDLPMTEGLLNISRIARVSEMFSAAGVSVIPHLNAWNERQWKYWTDILRDHSNVHIVSKEFQTGSSLPRNAFWQIDQLKRMEQRLGRRIHLVAIAGRRYVPELLGLGGFSIVDSQPFFQTLHRQVLTIPNGKWVLRRTRHGSMLDGLLAANIAAYRQGVEEKCVVIRKKKVATERANELLYVMPQEVSLKPERQLGLFSESELKKIA